MLFSVFHGNGTPVAGHYSGPILYSTPAVGPNNTIYTGSVDNYLRAWRLPSAGTGPLILIWSFKSRSFHLLLLVGTDGST
jgi:hypothetical protein